MKGRFLKQVLCMVLALTLVMGFMPTTAFAGYEDGTECEYCGGYRFDDWLCDCGPHCSEDSDSVDCYLAHHCANCLQSCDEDEKCDECEFCSECWGETGQHCALCSKHDDDTCENCGTCSDCQEDEGLHCAFCGGCFANLDECDQHPLEVGQENHCADCGLKCNDCGECYQDDFSEIFCEDCNQCFICAVANGYHCSLNYCCVPGERCDECENCVECGIDEGLHCPECAKHVDDWCERGGEGTHCMECAESVSCEQCGECTDCGEVEFCEECGFCEECCRDNAADEGCSCGDYCVLSGDWEEHFCIDCGTCFDENEACETCGYCIECCANQSDCPEGLCIEDADYDEHFCEQCNQCFHNVEACESCQDAGVMLCSECCSAVTEDLSCGHDYCVNSWQWEEHFCNVCQKCYDACDHEPQAHTHVYDTNGNCKVCGMNKDGKPVIYKQPKSVVAKPNDTSAKFTVEAYGDNLKYQWYYMDQAGKDFVAITDGLLFKGSQKKTLTSTITSGLCKSDKPVRLICEVKNKSATAVTEIVELSFAHKFGGYSNDATYHWNKCEHCTKTENKTEHRFGSWKVTQTATMETVGLKERTCYDCGFVSMETIPKLEEKHVHNYAAGYIQSSDYHWPQCSCGVENKGANEKHNYGEWVTTTQPTAATPGKQKRTCETCGYEDTKTITPQGHTHEFYNEAYIENHRDNGNYGSLIYDGHLVSLYQEPYGKTDKTFHYAYCVVDGCDAYEKYSHQWYTEWYDAPTSTSDGYYEIKCKDCFYVKKSVETPAGKYRIVTKGGSANVQTAKPGQKVKITPYSKYPVGQYFDPKNSSISVGYTWGNGVSGTWGWDVDVEYHAPDAEDTREYWYFTMPDIPAGKSSGNIETDYWNFYVDVEFEIYDCCSDEEQLDDKHYEWVNKVGATCGTPGYTGDFQCKYCNYVKIRGEVIPVTGEPHGTLIQEPSVEGTCTKSGYIGGKICSVCKQTVEPRVATGRKHNPVRVPGTYVPATCTSMGKSQQYNCADCGKVIKKSKTLAKISHEWEKIKGTATCTEAGTLDHWKCKTCNQYSLDEGVTTTRNPERINTPALGHGYNLTKVDGKAATCTSAGKQAYYQCTCGKYFEDAAGTKEISDLSSWGNIAAIDEVKLSYTKKVYTGKSIAAPELAITDTEGKAITSYDVTGLTAQTAVGRYRVTVTFKGNYEGSVDLYFTIVPKKVSSASANLSSASSTGGYDDIKVTWKKSSGATGYMVYYKKASASKWTSAGTTTKTSYTKKNLSDGVKYTFKVVPYYKEAGKTTKYYDSAQYKTASTTTLKKVTGVKAIKSGTKVKVSWKNIDGETGYQISKMTTKSATQKTPTTVKSSTAKSKLITATKGKTYYYKVRAYKVVDGKKVYGPWSVAVKFKRK